MKKTKTTEKPVLSYAQSGVDYHRIDPLKVMAQRAARPTGSNIEHLGYQEIAESRGESAYVIDIGDCYLASILECLGTKVVVADELRSISQVTYFDRLAQDTIAMAVNDIITVGAKPVSIHAYWAVGGMDWFDDDRRMEDLVRGWAETCNMIGAAWGGGETPSLQGIIETGKIDLAASCLGVIKPKERLTLGQRLQTGDTIVLLGSSGIHANGLTLARTLAAQLEQGYQTPMPDGRTYGEALMDPTTIYSRLLDELFEAGTDIHYISNITGHGWRKLMRHPARFTYRVKRLPTVPTVLQFLADKAGLDSREAYGALNMGAGMALYVPAPEAGTVIQFAERHGIRAWTAGVVEEGEKQVIIEPLDLTYGTDSLDLRDG